MTKTKRDPVLLFGSVLAGLTAFFSGGAGISILTDNDLVAAVFALGGLAVAAATVGFQFYVRGKVTPDEAVLERVVGGQVVAGAANEVVAPGTLIRAMGDGSSQEKALLEALAQVTDLEGMLDGGDVGPPRDDGAAVVGKV